jgi:hypothetical protein
LPTGWTVPCDGRGGHRHPDRDRITLGLVALAGRERDLILAGFRDARSRRGWPTGCWPMPTA